MKKLFFAVLAAFCFAICLASCSDGSSGDDLAMWYKVERAAISESDLSAITSASSPNETYANNVAIRKSLYEKSLSGTYGVDALKESAVLQALVELGLSQSQANEELAKLKSLQNYITSFSGGASSMWFYVEELYESKSKPIL